METHLKPSLATAVPLGATLSPQGNSLAVYPAVYPAASASPTAPPPSTGRQMVYFAQYDSTKYERLEFIVETYTLFSSLQKIASEAAATLSFQYRPSSVLEPPPPAQIQYYNRISRLYREAVIKQFPIINADTTQTPEAKNRDLSHHATVHGILSLSEILYLPFDARGDGVVGEEILDWVNTVDRAPSTEEGEELADLSRPWEHPNFWPYIYRCILRAHLLSASALLSLVASHPSPVLQSLAALPLDLLRTFPRSTAFKDEREFLLRLRDWRVQARSAVLEAEALFEEAESDPELGGEDREVERMDWETGFRCLLELMEGKEKRVLEASEDWREALGAWGVWVNAGGRREDLPDTLALITKHHPVDGTLPSEVVQSSLILNDVARALQQLNLISTWLVAHLADLLSKVTSLDLPSAPTLPLRDHFILSYTDLLLSDPALWRVVVDYLASCGATGRARMSAVLLSVPLDIDEVPAPKEDAGMDVEGSEKENAQPGAVASTVEDVLRVCAENGLDDEMRSVCKIYSEDLIARKRYGEAVSFCIRARDAKRVARIAERVLEEYIVNGQEAFIHHVDSIPTSLLRPSGSRADPFGSMGDAESAYSMDEDSPSTPYTSLNFLARYRDFFALYARGDRQQAAGLLVLLLTSKVAPKSFYAVMLLDVIPLLESDQLLISTEETYELLRCLEEITSPISAAGGDVYGHLDSLIRVMGQQSGTRGERTSKALKQLEVVRAALAKHLGRCYCL